MSLDSQIGGFCLCLGSETHSCGLSAAPLAASLDPFGLGCDEFLFGFRDL